MTDFNQDKQNCNLLFIILLQIDKDRDGFVSFDEFMTASKGEEFEKDEGWKSVEEEHPYTDKEMEEFENQLAEEEKKRLEQQKLAEEAIKKATEHIQVGSINHYRV